MIKMNVITTALSVLLSVSAVHAHQTAIVIPLSTCPSELESCDGTCVDTRNNPDHCGGCDASCGSDQACRDGICTGEVATGGECTINAHCVSGSCSNGICDGITAGGECTINYDCASEYCAKSVGDCNGNGECTARPGACPDVWSPVCGCDDTTYSNNCYAAMAGVTVSYSGECTVACSTNTDCQPSKYCAKSTGDCNGNGECNERPGICPDVWDPVCGCDNTTYGNSCYAAANSANIISTGSCP